MPMRAWLTTEDLPPSLLPLRACQAFAPEAGFDPAGDWEHSYRLWVRHFDTRDGSERHGSLRLRRARAADGGLSLEVRQESVERDGSADLVVAELTCAADALATPRRWHLTRFLLDDDRRPLDGTRFDELGEVGTHLVARRLAGDEELPVPAAWTANWCLFDCVQRLAPDAAPLEFDLHDELARLRPGHRLAPVGTATATLHGHELLLTGFELTGPGTLPFTFWRDEGQRVLVAADLQRGFVWDANAGPPRTLR